MAFRITCLSTDIFMQNDHLMAQAEVFDLRLREEHEERPHGVIDRDRADRKSRWQAVTYITRSQSTENSDSCKKYLQYYLVLPSEFLLNSAKLP
jgi:hypothetical protein